ncbi:MAG: hypothetical protein A2Y13_05405 [Planctomycetes bacterium GWC2_45_44]|nr:MAG: hypothetical protein A2Y13_05405 [Planctomycetes bacterium GWC2_45_44]
MKIALKIFSLTFVVLVGCSTITNAQQSDANSVHYQTRKQLFSYPAYDFENKSENAVDAKNFMVMTDCEYGSLTLQQADEKIKHYYDQGFSVILSEGSRYLFRDSIEEPVPNALKFLPFPENIDSTKKLVDACHKYGMKFYVHLTSTMISQQLLEKHPDWTMIDLATNKPRVNGYGTVSACINNDDFMKAYLDRLETYIKEVRPDGIMQDEIQFWGPTTCGCKSCREKFKADTGFDIPENSDGWIYHFADSPSYAAWLEWRRAKVMENMKKVRTLLKKYNPDGIVTHYVSSNSAIWCYYATGLVIDDFPAFADNVGYECQPPDFQYLYYWPQIIFEMKYLRAVAEGNNSGMWTLFYNQTNSDTVLNWFVMMSQGSSVWWRDGGNEKVRAPLISWENKFAKICSNLKNAANIGILFSLDTRDRNPETTSSISWSQSFAGVCYAMTDGHLPYKVILESDMQEKSLNDKIDTLLLFNTGSMSDKAVQTAKDFVQNGGTLIASSSTSLYDQTGKKRSDFGLSEIFGFSYQDLTKEPSKLVLGDGKELEHKQSFVQLKNIASDVTVAGRMVLASGKEYPGFLVRNYGKGKVIYFAGYPELNYFFSYYGAPKIVPGQYWKDERKPEYGKLLCDTILSNTKRLPVQLSYLPKGVVAEAYNHHLGGIKGIQVHLANLTGAYLTDGKVPMTRCLEFPDVMSMLNKQDKAITISVEANDIKDVFLISPDFDTVVSLPYTERQGCTLVKLEKFYRYSILYFNQGDSVSIRKYLGKISDSIPAPKELIYDIIKPLAGKYDPNSITIFVDSNDCKGGYDVAKMENETTKVIYGKGSNFSELEFSFNMDKQFNNPVLELGAKDDGDATKASIKIMVNGSVVFEGASDFPDQSWLVKRIKFNEELLVKGKNVIAISNIGTGPQGYPPWVAVNFIRILSQVE